MGIKYFFDSGFNEVEKELFIKANNEDYNILYNYFNFKTKININYYVYSSREKKYINDPFHSISRASSRWHINSIYRYWEKDEDAHFPHELIHLFAHNLSKAYKYNVDLDTYDNKIINIDLPMVSTSFMQEGLAIALEDMLFSRKIYEGGRREYLDILVSNIKDWDKINEDIINFEGFSKVENGISIPFTGYLTKYLINNYGLEKYIEIYITIKETNSVKENIEVFNKVTGKKYLQLKKEIINIFNNI